MNAIVKDLNSLHNNFIKDLKLEGFPSLSLSVTTDGKLEVSQDLPTCIELFLADRIRKNLGLSDTLKAGTYRVTIKKAAIAMSIRSPDLIANDSDKYNELAIVALANRIGIVRKQFVIYHLL